MATSATTIANLALAHLGVSVTLGDVTTEGSKEALACRTFYETARDEVLAAFHWPFARKTATLTLVEEFTEGEWGYSYRYPTDCLHLRRLPSGLRNETAAQRTVYQIGQDTSGRLIYTDLAEATAEYTEAITNPERFPPHFVMALSYLLAHYIAPQLTGGDPTRLGDKAFALYQRKLAEARASALNEERRDLEPEAEYINVRGG